MLRRGRVFCAVASLLALISITIACGSTSSSSPKIRLVNTTPDEITLDLLIDTKSAATGVAYGTASSYVSVDQGSRQFQIEPSGSTTILIDRTDNIASGNTLSLVALNFSFNPSSILIPDDNSAPTTGNFKLRILNASPGMLAQDVYVVTAGTDIGSVDTPTFPALGFGSVSDYTTLAPGDYDVIFAPPGFKFITLDSGKLTFAAGQVRTLLGLNDPAGGFKSTLLTDAN